MLSQRQSDFYTSSIRDLDWFILPEVIWKQLQHWKWEMLKDNFCMQTFIGYILLGEASTLCTKRMAFFLGNMMVKILILNTNLKALSFTFMCKNCISHGSHHLKWVLKIKAPLEALLLFQLLLKNYLYTSDVKLNLEKIWLGLNANRSQSSLFHEIKTMLENTSLSWPIRHTSIKYPEHLLISKHRQTMASQILELRGKNFYIDICITTTWNNHFFFVLMRINKFFLACTVDISPFNFVSQRQTKRNPQIVNKLYKLFLAAFCCFFFHMPSGFYSFFLSCMDFFPLYSHLWIWYYNCFFLLFLLMKGYSSKYSFRHFTFWLVNVWKKHCRHLTEEHQLKSSEPGMTTRS